MKFNDAILAGIVLNREAMQSEDFSNDDEAGITGWRLEKTGEAFFYSVAVGGNNYTISPDGQAAFDAVWVNTDVYISGRSLLEILQDFPIGCIAVANSANWTVDSIRHHPQLHYLLRDSTSVLYDSRVYRYHLEYELVGTTTNDVFRTTIRYTTDGSTPATTSAIIDGTEQKAPFLREKESASVSISEWRPSSHPEVMKSAVVISSIGNGNRLCRTVRSKYLTPRGSRRYRPPIVGNRERRTHVEKQE